MPSDPFDDGPLGYSPLTRLIFSADFNLEDIDQESDASKEGEGKEDARMVDIPGKRWVLKTVKE
jgi:hypothetical protein